MWRGLGDGELGQAPRTEGLHEGLRISGRGGSWFTVRIEHCRHGGVQQVHGRLIPRPPPAAFSGDFHVKRVSRSVVRCQIARHAEHGTEEWRC